MPDTVPAAFHITRRTSAELTQYIHLSTTRDTAARPCDAQTVSDSLAKLSHLHIHYSGQGISVPATQEHVTKPLLTR